MRRIVSILGRERDFETLEFSLQFSLGRLGDKSENTDILSTLGELLVAKAGLVLNKGSPRDRDCDRFSSHKG
jgi:hypothetical protein